MTRPDDREFALVAACCRWPRGAARNAAIAAAAAESIDWPRVERLIKRHRITALVHDGLRDAAIAVPCATADRLRDAARKAGQIALAMAGETMRLQAAFDAAGVPVLFVKGSAMAMLAYGEVGIKQSWDVDLLTIPDQALAGRRLLEACGYDLFEPRVGDAAFLRFVGVAKEAIFSHEQRGIAVELHWRLLDTPPDLMAIGTDGPTQIVPLPGGGIRTLADESLFAYLCGHGTIHAWSRLKWLADLSAFLARRSPREIEALYYAAMALGADRSPAVSLLLCNRVLGLPLPEQLLRRLERDRWTRLVVRTALFCMGYEGEITPYSVPGMRLELSHFLLGGRGGFRHMLRRKWVSPVDRITLALPARLAFLYGVLRVPLWGGRKLRRILGKRAG